MASLKLVEEIIDLEEVPWCVIPARLGCLAREEPRNLGSFARQPRARVINSECTLSTIYLAHFKLRTLASLIQTPHFISCASL